MDNWTQKEPYKLLSWKVFWCYLLFFFMNVYYWLYGRTGWFAQWIYDSLFLKSFQSFKDITEYWHLFTYLDPFKISCILSALVTYFLTQSKHPENVNYLPLFHHNVLLEHSFCEHIHLYMCHTILIDVSVF